MAPRNIKAQNAKIGPLAQVITYKPHVGSTDAITFTVGYAGRTLVDFLRALEDARVARVVDIRELPLSRRRGFSKTPLKTALAERGIEYVHLRAAGNPYRTQKADIQRCLALYASHLDAHPEVVAEVEATLTGVRAALLCFEAEVSECHRSVLAARLRASNPRRRFQHL